MAEEGVYWAVGRRKTSVARVRIVVPGSGEIVINRKALEEYFPRDTWRNEVKFPLRITDNIERVNVYANVGGGGLSGQAGAIRHGIARALVEANPSWRKVLKKEGVLTRDQRMKERKKYGQRGARARFQYSKR